MMIKRILFTKDCEDFVLKIFEKKDQPFDTFEITCFFFKFKTVLFINTVYSSFRSVLVLNDKKKDDRGVLTVLSRKMNHPF